MTLGTCPVTDRDGNRCVRAPGHNPRKLRHVAIVGGQPVLIVRRPAPRPRPEKCEMCLQRKPEVHPSYRWLRHGWICTGCRLALQIAKRSCPPRYSDSPAELRDRASDLRDRAGAVRLRLYRNVALTDSLARHTDPLVALVRDVAGWHVGSGSMWAMEMVEPTLADAITTLRRARVRLQKEEAALDDGALNRLRQATMVEKTVVDLDNPFEDSSFLLRVLASPNDVQGASDREGL